MIEGHFCIDLWQNLRPGILQRLFLNSYFCGSLRFIYLSIYLLFQLLFTQYQKAEEVFGEVKCIKIYSYSKSNIFKISFLCFSMWVFLR